MRSEDEIKTVLCGVYVLFTAQRPANVWMMNYNV